MAKKEMKFSHQQMTALENEISPELINQLQSLNNMKIGNKNSTSSKKLFGPLKLLGKLNDQFENHLLPALTSIRPSMCVPLQELIEIYNSMFFL